MTDLRAAADMTRAELRALVRALRLDVARLTAAAEALREEVRVLRLANKSLSEREKDRG